MKSMRRLSLLNLLALVAVGAHARINFLEPLTPGLDTHVTERPWNQAVHATVASGAGQWDGDLTSIDYALTAPLGRDWEVGGTWGIVTLDSSGGRDDSGLSDLTLGAKRKIPSAYLPPSLKGVGEFGFSLPTGDSDHGIGAGGIGLMGNAGLSLPIRSVKGYAQLGFKTYTGSGGTKWGSVLSYSAGAMYPLQREWLLSADLRVISHAKDKINGTKMKDAIQEAYLAPGGVWSPSELPLELQGLLLIGLTDDAYDFGFQVGARF